MDTEMYMNNLHKRTAETKKPTRYKIDSRTRREMMQTQQ